VLNFKLPFKTFKVGLKYTTPSFEARTLAEKYGFLPYMVERYIKMFGNIEEVEELLKTTGKGLTKSIRCNILKIECNNLLKRLKSKGLKLKNIPWVNTGYWVLEGGEKLGYLHEYLFGYYFIQGAPSMVPPLELNPSPNDVVLDMCAAPGGKTTHLAELMGNKGVILAVDISRSRMKTLRSNISRMGVANTVLLKMNSKELGNYGEFFTKILLDAPCTGEGLLPIDASRKEKTQLQDLFKMASRQLELLKSAIKALKPGGTLVYSTCSIAPEENEFVINEILNLFKNVSVENLSIISRFGVKGFTEVFGIRLRDELAKCYRVYPHKHEMEGYFICKLIKKG